MTGNKILCIEDEAEIRQIIVEELHDAGYETIEADSGKSGLAAIMANHPDLVLCDMNMPEMDGNQLLETLRSDHPDYADMPFVFLTAQTDRHSMLNGKKLGADDYLTKPIDFELLLVTLESRLGQVQRMEAKKEQQLVKLYQSVAGSGPAPVADGPANGAAANAMPTTVPPVDTEGHDELVFVSNENDGKVTAGRLQFVGLDLIRSEIGDRWPAFEERVFDITEKTIARRVDPGDVFHRDEHGNYVICFSRLGEAEASFKADRIADEIREKIIGTDVPLPGTASAPAIGGAQISPAPAANFPARAAESLKSEVHSIPLSQEDIQSSESVFDLVMGRLDQAAAQNRQSQAATLTEILDTCQIRLGSIELNGSGQTPFRLAAFDEATQLKIAGLMARRENPENLAAEIDMLRVTKVAEHIYANPANANLVDITDISYSTLNGRRHQEHIVTVLKSLGEAVTTSIALKITGVPVDVYPSKFNDLTNIIRPYCRLLVIELGGPALGNIEPANMRLPVVACQFDKLAPTLAKSPQRLKQFIQEIHNGKARFLVHSIPNLEEKVLLSRLGVDLLSTV